MALYEGISLIQEKQAVVLDLGYDYIKFGFVGEAAPRCIIRSEFWCPAARRRKRVFDYRSREELHDNLVQILHTLYFRHVLVNPKERRVVVCESLLTPTLLRDTLADVLLTHYEVPAAAWLGAARAASLLLAAPVALVVDVGARDAEVTPVIHGWALPASATWAALGARMVRRRLRELLAEDQPDANIDEDMLEDIAVKACFVGTQSRAAAWASGSPPPQRVLWYRGCGGALRVSGAARERPAEALFERDRDLLSLPDLVLQAIEQCPVDARAPLAASIVLTGGGARLPGLAARLREELYALLPTERYRSKLFIKTFKFHSPALHSNIISWAGAAAAGAGAGGAGGAGRAALTPVPRAPDWPSLLNHRDKYQHLDM